MNIPNLITITKEKEIEDFVFVDLQLNQVLTYSDIVFLKWPCKKQEIQKRQDIFRSLQNENFYFALKKVITAIIEYEKKKEQLRLAKTELEKHYKRYNVLTGYVAVCESLSQLKGYCQAADTVAKFFLSEDITRRQKCFNQNLTEWKLMLDRISRCTFTFAKEDSAQKDHISSSYLDKINTYAKAMDFEMSSPCNTLISLDETLSHVITQLYPQEILKIHFIEAEYKEQLETDFFDIKSQISFIINIWDLVQKAKGFGIPYTFPKVSDTKEIHIYSAYGISLLSKVSKEIVPNTIQFDETSPFCFVTGANGGGKTEYLRNLGTNLLLFLAGCPIFAERAWVYPFTYVSTHFPKDERYEKVGRLEDEKQRVTQMLNLANSESVLLFNETFSGTEETLGLSLLLKLTQTLSEKNTFGLAVTHLKGIELEKYPVLCPEVVQTPNGEYKRTFRIKRRINSVEAHANDIIRKYQLDAESLAKRKEAQNG